MRRLSLLVLFALIARPLLAADDLLTKAFHDAKENGANYYEENAIGVVCDAIDSSANVDEFLATIATNLRVTPATARVLALSGLLLSDAIEQKSVDVVTLESMLVEAWSHESNRAPVVAHLAALAARSDDPLAATRRLLPLLTDSASTLAAAEAAQYQSSPLILQSGLERDPDDQALIDASGRLLFDPHTAAACGPLRITSRGVTLRDSQNIERIRTQIDAIAALGLPRLLLQAFDALPAATKDLVLRESSSSHLSLDLAAAALLEGQPERARTFPVIPVEHDDGEGARALLAASFPEAKPDAFDVIRQVLDDSFANPFGVSGQLLAQFAQKHGYDAFGAEILRETRDLRGTVSDTLPAALTPLLASLREQIDAANTSDDARLQLLEHSRDAASAPSSLNAPRIVPFTEHRLEDLDGTLIAAEVIDCDDAQRVAATTHLPPNVSPIRMERRGEDVVAVVISSALDPVGEVGLGAYWVLRSRDGGNRWTSYYTGLRENMPYVVPLVSTLPLFDDERLRIEVHVKELDLSSISFPPVAMRLVREERGLYLDLPWSELTRDSDSDGLTDLFEERITTDPHDLDTDGDGIADGEDLLPRVARIDADTIESRVIAAAIANFALGGGRIVVGIGGDPAAAEAAQNSCEVQTSNVGGHVLFLIGDPSLLAPLTLTRRTIVLTPEESARYAKKFGPTFGASIRKFIIDHSGTRAILELNQSWTGSTLLLTKTEDGWTVEYLTMWIS